MRLNIWSVKYFHFDFEYNDFTGNGVFLYWCISTFTALLTFQETPWKKYSGPLLKVLLPHCTYSVTRKSNLK